MILLGMQLLALVIATVGIAVALARSRSPAAGPRLLWVVPCVLAVELVAGRTFAPQYHRPIAVGPEPPRLTPPPGARATSIR